MALLKDIVKFFIVLFTAITVYCLLFAYLKGLGFPDPAKMENLDSFFKMEADVTNTTFLYCSGCVVFMAVFLLYRILVFRQLEQSYAGLLSEAASSIFFLAMAWPPPAYPKNIVLFSLRLFVLVLACWVGKIHRVSKYLTEKRQRQLTYVFLGVSVWIVLVFLMKHVLGDFSGVMSIFLGPGAVIVTAVLYILAVFEKRVPPLIVKFIDATFLLAIVILTVRNDVHYFDFSNFLSAVNDVMLGKDILQNVVCQYGFFNIYFIAVLFKIFSVQDIYAALSLVNSAFYVLGYSFIYYFFRRYTRNLVFSILAVFSIFVVSFYVLNNVPQHWAPSVGFLRFGTIFPVFCLLYSQRLRQNKYWEWFLAFFVVFSVFWVIETGIYILASIIGIATMKCLILQDKRERKSLLAILPKMAIIFIAIVTILTLWIAFKYGTWPVWGDLIYYQRFYLTTGVGVQPLTDFYMWPIAAFVYWVTVYVCLTYYDRLKHADAWLFLGFFGMQSLLYYISIVIFDHLARAALSATILFFAFLGFVVKRDFVSQFRHLKVRWKYPVYFLTVGLVVWLVPIVQRYGEEKSLWRLLKDNAGEFVKNARSDSLERLLPKKRVHEFRYDVAKIIKLIPPDAPLAIISKHDTLFHVYSRRKSLFKIAFYPNFSYTQNQIPEAAETILNSGQTYLFIDNSSYHCYNNTVNPNNANIQALLSGHFRKVESLGLLDLYVRQ